MRYFIYFTRVVYVIMNNKRGGRLGLLIFLSSCDGNVKCKLWFSKNGEGVLMGEYVAIYLIPWIIPTIQEKRYKHYNGSFAGVV